MQNTRRCLLVGPVAATVLLLGLGACSDHDHTEICVGPGCSHYDGFGGSTGHAGTSSGGTSGSADTADAGSEPDADTPEPPDSGQRDAAPDANVSRNCEVRFVTPVSTDAGDLTLTGSDDTDDEACGSAFTTHVAVASNADSLTLFINDNPSEAQSVLQPATEFVAILGNRGATPNTLRARATMSDGRTCEAVFFGDVFVDCPGPSCTLESPLANADGYLNATDDRDVALGLQTSIVVSSELEHAGQVVKLELDSDDEALDDQLLAEDGSVSIATFDNVTLLDGQHSVQAECRDAFDRVTLSPLTVWKVDSTPCTLSIDQLANGADPITPGDDEDSDPTNGLQVSLTGQITGNDCKILHVGACGGGGRDDIDLSALDLPDDGRFEVRVTLAGTTGSLDVCANVEDAAGNVSTDRQASVNVRTTPPAVNISSPTTGTRFNVAGSGGAVRDDAPQSTTCETTVLVDCTEEGSDVELLVDGDVVATATCQSLPPPFAGRASFALTSLPTKNDGSATTLSARQDADGLPAGVAADVTVQTDCEPPSCTLQNANLDQDTLNAGLDSSSDPELQNSFVVATDIDALGELVRLVIDGDQGSSRAAPAGPDADGALASFDDVTLAEGSRSVQAICTDAAGNVRSSASKTWTVDSVACSTTLLVAGGADPITTVHDLAGSPDLQVSATGQTSGGDCTGVRVGICGTLSGAFSPLVGSPNFSEIATIPSADGPATLCVEVEDDAGNVSSTEFVRNVRVTPPVASITSPLANTIFNGTADCDPLTAGLQVDVQGTTDAADGSPVLVKLGAGSPQTVSVSALTFQACVEALDGDNQALTASVTDSATSLAGSTSVQVTVDTSVPGTIDPPTFTVTGRREGTLDLHWVSITDTDGDPLSAYQLRCATEAIVDDAGWTAATPIPVPQTPAPSAGVTETLGLTAFRTGTTRFCVVRGEDDAGLLSPMAANLSGTISNAFLKQQYTVTDDANTTGPSGTVLNVSLDPLGDINGDGLADFIYGATNRGAEIFLGTTTLTPSTPKLPDIVIRNTGAVGATLGFGAEVAGLGDITGDGKDDFAVTARGANSVFIFFGRDVPGGDPAWPSTINLSAGCTADLCLTGAAVTAQPLFGWDVHSGDFDGTPPNDLVITARSVTVNGQTGAGRVFVVLGGSQLNLTPGSSLVLPTSNPDGFIIDPPASRTFFGVSATSVPGPAGRTDLVIASNAGTTGGSAAGLFFVPGRAHVGTGLTTLNNPLTDVIEFDTGPVGNYATPVRALGDFDGDTFIDIATGRDFNSGGGATLYRGQPSGGFSSSSRLSFTNDMIGLDDNYGQFMAQGFHPALGLLGDLDKDGTAEFLLGATTPDAGTRGLAMLFYGSSGASGRPRTTADFTYTPTNLQVVPNFVGDINDDTYSDFAILDSGTGANVVFLMY